MIELIAATFVPDPVLRACADCRYLRGAVSLWCQNDRAIAAHRTLIPGRIGCRFWAPMRQKKDLTKWERWFGSHLEC